jgi:hypothetical protein
MSKTFTGSWVIMIILIILCWPAALIYFFMKYEEQPQFGGPTYYGSPNQPYQQNQPPYQQAQPPYQQSGAFCQKCGSSYEPGAQFCPKCGNRLN